MAWIAPIWAFIRRLNLSQIALVGVIGLALFWRVSLGLERRHSEKLQRRVNELVEQVTNMTTKQDTQTKVTEGNVRKVEQTRNPVAERIEAAPVGDKCETPGLELGRAEL